jgi:hypothetical protein
VRRETSGGEVTALGELLGSDGDECWGV